jgi:hypothetical protein
LSNGDILDGAMCRAVAILALAALAALTGCEGVVCSEGTVSDAMTNAPLADVEYDVLELDEAPRRTDATGFYRACGPLVGCIDGCPDIHVQFTKDGYRAVTLTTPADVALEPQPVPSTG